MTDRITKERLENSIESLNRRMERHGSIYRYEVVFQNGKSGITRRYDTMKLGTSASDVRYGTKGEMYEFIYAMMTALDDAEVTENVYA